MGVYNLSKIRVYELAKELGMTSKELIEKAVDLNLNINRTTSKIKLKKIKVKIK